MRTGKLVVNVNYLSSEITIDGIADDVARFLDTERGVRSYSFELTTSDPMENVNAALEQIDKALDDVINEEE